STRLEVGVDLEGTHFGDALLDRPLDLSPTNHNQVVVPVRFEWAGLGAGAKALLSRRAVGYTIAGRVLLDTPVGDKAVGLTGKGHGPLRKLLPLGGSKYSSADRNPAARRTGVPGRRAPKGLGGRGAGGRAPGRARPARGYRRGRAGRANLPACGRPHAQSLSRTGEGRRAEKRAARCPRDAGPVRRAAHAGSGRESREGAGPAGDGSYGGDPGHFRDPGTLRRSEDAS